MERKARPANGDVLEYRRLRAWSMYQQGYRQREIAKALDVTDGAVSQWISKARLSGVDALKKRPLPGAPSNLSQKQKEELPQLLLKGAEVFGFRGEVWTQKRVAEVIERHFGVRYHPSHVSKVLKACGWSRQKPVKRATQRDEAAIQRWAEEKWPALKKSV